MRDLDAHESQYGLHDLDDDIDICADCHAILNRYENTICDYCKEDN